MKRGKINTGIELVCQERKQTKTTTGHKFVNYIMDCVLLVALLYGSICGATSVCGFYEKKTTVLLSLAIVVVIGYGAFCLNRRWICVTVYLLISAIFLYMSWGLGLTGAKELAAKYIEFINEYFKTDLYVKYQVKGIVPPKAVLCFQIYVAWICVFLAGIFRKIYKRSLIALISPTVIFSLIFIVGLIPETQYIFAFLIGFLPLAISCKGKDNAFEIQTKLTSLVSIGVLLIICMLVVPKKTFEKNYASILSVKEDIRNIKNRDFMEDIRYYFSDWGGMSGSLFDGGYAGANNGRVGNKDKVRFDKKTDFFLTKEKRQFTDMFLQIYIGSDYTNGLWGDLKYKKRKTYEGLEKEYQYNFNNLTRDMLIVNNKLLNVYEEDTYQDNTYEDDAMSYVDYKIEKKDIGKKHTLLPCLVKSDVKSKNGLLYTDSSYKKKEYVESASELGIMEPMDPTYYDTDYVNRQGLFHASRNIMYCYDQLGKEEIHEPDSNFAPTHWEIQEDESMIELLKKFSERELAYRKFVYDTYTQVPKEVAPKLQELLETDPPRIFYIENDPVEYKKSFVDYKNPFEVYSAVWTCQKFLNDKADYSLEPGRTPDGKDMIDYFLFENHKGYCTYFATAATIYLRLLGVPARYVEGYKVTEQDFTKRGKQIGGNAGHEYRLPVTDEAAHAWIEVYVSGCGWIPFEVTPGRGPVSLDENNAGQKNKVQPSNMPSKTPPSKTAPKVTPAHKTKEPVSKSDKPTGSKGMKHNIPTNRVVRVIMLWVLGLLLIAGVIETRRRLILRSKKEKEHQLENNQRIKFYYHELNKMIGTYLKLGRKEEMAGYIDKVADNFENVTPEELERFIAIVEKATFSCRQASDYECAKCRFLYENIRKDLYKNVSIIKKLYYLAWKVF